MKKERRISFGVVLTLFLSTLFLPSCLDDNDDNTNILRFVYEPVIIESMDGNIGMKTQYGDILAPRLGNTKAGDYYLTNFMVDTTVNPITAYVVDYIRMGADTLHVNMNASPSTEYNIPIRDLGIYLEDPLADDLLKGNKKSAETSLPFICLDSTFFVQAFFDNNEVPHEMEFFTFPDSMRTNIPTLYVRAKSTDLAISRKSYALNFSILPKSTALRGTQSVTFNLKYKSGGDGQGNEVYTDYKKNPVTLILKN